MLYDINQYCNTYNHYCDRDHLSIIKKSFPVSYVVYFCISTSLSNSFMIDYIHTYVHTIHTYIPFRHCVDLISFGAWGV